MKILINNLGSYSDRELISIVDGMKMGIISYTFENLRNIQSEIINRRLDASYAAIVGELMRQNMNIPADTQPVHMRGQQQAQPHLAENSQPYPQRSMPQEPRQSGGWQAYTQEYSKAMPVQRPVAEYANTPQPIYSPKNVQEDSGYYDPAVRLRAPQGVENERESLAYSESRYPMLNFCMPFYKIIGWIFALALVAGFAFYAALFMINDLYLVFQVFGIVVVVAAFILITCYFQAERTRLMLDILRELQKR